jgi:hypothetical protein
MEQFGNVYEFVVDEGRVVMFDGRVIEQFVRGELPPLKWRIHVRHVVVQVFPHRLDTGHKVVIGDRGGTGAAENIEFDIPDERFAELRTFVELFGLP